MFERELIEPMFLDRWTIVRTLTRQSVAEHTYLVAHYANDIAVKMYINPMTHLRLMQRALWHDVDEQFTGDIPGPSKRGLLNNIGPNAKATWDAQLRAWMSRVFENLTRRSGGGNADPASEVIDLILKTADWMEAAVRMATETQMGNKCAERHIGPNKVAAIATAHKLCELYFDEKIDPERLPSEDQQGAIMCCELAFSIDECVRKALHEQSAGPWITKEDANRDYHEPCVDNDR